MTRTADDEERAAKRNWTILGLDLTFVAVFIPQSKSRNAGEEQPTLNWIVTLSANGCALTVPYSQGIRHVPGRPQHFDRTLHGRDMRKAFDAAAETGKYPRRFRSSSAAPIDYSALPGPTLADVLYSLVSDADAVNSPFEEWAGDLGYDTDSRKAHATYLACVDIGIRLRRLVGGDAGLEALRVAFQDY